MPQKILIVDDESDLVELVRTRLEASGFEVVSASDGQEGVDKVKSENPDLVLMDVMMPKMSGGDAVRILSADPKTAQVPIIFLTAVVTKSEESDEFGINIDNKYYPSLAKPFDSDILIGKISEVLGE